VPCTPSVCALRLGNRELNREKLQRAEPDTALEDERVSRLGHVGLFGRKLTPALHEVMPSARAQPGLGLRLVLVMQSPPHVRRRLRPPLGRILPGLLAAQRCQVQEVEVQPEVVDTASVGEIGAVYRGAVAKENAESEEQGA